MTTKCQTPKKKSKHRYSTIILCALFLLAIIAGVFGYIESEDIDEVCDQNNTELKRINGTWQCWTPAYGELYIYNDTNPYNVELNTINVANFIGNMTMGESNQISFTNNYRLVSQRNTTYEINVMFSFTGGANSEYRFAVRRNANMLPECRATRTIGSTATVGVGGMTCIATAEEGDYFSVVVLDADNPVTDATFRTVNFNIMEVG